jgi:glyoxylase-like metal-dependent hydrolase (beta-lactamase superfamily II)
MHLSRVEVLKNGFCRQLACLAGERSWRVKRFWATFLYLEHPQHGAALIDTGYSPHFFPATRRWPGRLYRWVLPVRLDAWQDAWHLLQAQGIDPAAVQRVFISHFHGDHIAGLRDFPQARFVYRREAYEQLRGLSPRQQVRQGFLAGLLPEDFAARAEGLDDAMFAADSQRLAGLKACDYWGDGSLLLVDLPGHALGHTGFLLNTAPRPWFYLADACWSLEVLETGRSLPGLTARLQHCGQDYQASQQRLRELHRREECLLLASHCERTLRYAANS